MSTEFFLYSNCSLFFYFFLFGVVSSVIYFFLSNEEDFVENRERAILLGIPMNSHDPLKMAAVGQVLLFL